MSTAGAIAVPRFPVPAKRAPANAAALAALAAPAKAEGAGGVIADSLEGALRSFQALPVFLYPSVTGTAAEKALIFETLDRLPMKDVGAIPTVRVVDNLDFFSRGQGTILGVTFGSGDMAVSRTGGYNMPNSDDLMRYIVMHESGHAHDFQGGILHAIFMRKSNDGPWGHPPFPTQYSEGAPPEDFAEGHAFYHMRPDELDRVRYDVGARTTDLKEFNHDKWQAMHDSEQPNLMEQIVAQKPFRDTGRLVGELTSNHVGAALHTGLGFLSMVSMFELVTGGFTQILGAVRSHSAQDAVKGGLQLAAGAALAVGAGHPLLGPAALLMLGAKRGMEQAEKLAAASPGTKAHATAAAVGGAIGGVVGGIAGPLGGTLAGYTIGGPIGGVVGLVAGSLVGFRGGSALGAKAAIALAK